jgi:PKD repeat protein
VNSMEKPFIPARTGALVLASLILFLQTGCDDDDRSSDSASAPEISIQAEAITENSSVESPMMKSVKISSLQSASVLDDSLILSENALEGIGPLRVNFVVEMDGTNIDEAIWDFDDGQIELSSGTMSHVYIYNYDAYYTPAIRAT